MLLQKVEASLSPWYLQAHRAYHSLAHVNALLTLQSQYQHLIQGPLSVSLAIWFHDAIYDVQRQDNEEQSAQLAERLLADWDCQPACIASVARKIRATQHHSWTDGDPDAAVFLDFDLAILAALGALYDRYAAEIAQEYNWVPPPAYQTGRAKVLKSFLDRPTLYFTPELRTLWEAQARANLSRELSAL